MSLGNDIKEYLIETVFELINKQEIIKEFNLQYEKIEEEHLKTKSDYELMED